MPSETLTSIKSKHLKTSDLAHYTLKGYNLPSYTLTGPVDSVAWEYALIGFCDAAETYKYNNITSAVLTLKLKVTSDTQQYQVILGANKWAFNVDDTKNPSTDNLGTYTQADFTQGTWKTISLTLSRNQIYNVAKYGIQVQIGTAYGNQALQLEVDASACTCKLTYSTYLNGAVLTNVYPESGTRVDRTKDIPVSATVSPSNVSMETVRAVSYTLSYYKSTGSSSNPTVITGTFAKPTSSVNVVIPADSFEAGNYYYKLEVVLNSTKTTDTGWISLRAADTVPTAPTNLIPNGTYEDGRQTIGLSWTHNNETGTPATKSEVYNSVNGTDYSLYVTATGEDTRTAVNIQTSDLYEGAFWWKVRTYNIDDVAGPFSEPAHFYVIMAPAAPTITTVNAVPKAGISWSAPEQYAYEVQVDGKTVKRDFGNVKSWESSEILEDGAHTIGVSVQGSTGLWSAFKTVDVNISNVPYGTIQLNVVSTDFAALAWTPSTAHDRYLIYRNGELIGNTSGTEFTDEYSAGETEYFVRGVTAQVSNYSESNTVRVNVQCNTMIKAVSGSDWLQLPYADTQHRTETISASRNINLVHMAGRPYQEAELSEHYTESMTVVCAFDKTADKRQLEGLVGQIVVLKTSNGRVIAGAMGDLTTKESNMYTAYSFVVTRLNEVLAYE